MLSIMFLINRNKCDFKAEATVLLMQFVLQMLCIQSACHSLGFADAVLGW